MNISKTDRIKEVWMQVRDKDRRRLETLMAVNDISQRELSRMMGWKSHTYIGRIIRGEITSIDPETAAKIAAIFGVGMDDLFLARVSTEAAHIDQRKGTAA